MSEEKTIITCSIDTNNGDVEITCVDQYGNEYSLDIDELMSHPEVKPKTSINYRGISLYDAIFYVIVFIIGYGVYGDVRGASKLLGAELFFTLIAVMSFTPIFGPVIVGVFWDEMYYGILDMMGLGSSALTMTLFWINVGFGIVIGILFTLFIAAFRRF